jgi:hypothetical protein
VYGESRAGSLRARSLAEHFAAMASEAPRRSSSVQMQGKFAGLHWLFARRGKRTPWSQSERPRIELVMATFWGLADVTVTRRVRVDVRVLEREGIVVVGMEGDVVVRVGVEDGMWCGVVLEKIGEL